MKINKHGLKRTIPESVKRKVRQKCGFGCVKCGNAIYQYEHVIPTFSNAKEHDSDCIVLLCGSCHDQVTRGLLSKEAITKLSLKPKCKQKGFSSSIFDIDSEDFKVIFGTLICKNVDSIININGKSIFTINKPEAKGSPFLISAYLADSDGSEVLKIIDNEWFTSSENWDVKVVGSRIIINKKKGDISLILRSEPPNNIIVEKLDMMHYGAKINCLENTYLKVSTAAGTTLDIQSIITEISNQEFAIRITNDEINMGTGVMYSSGI